MIITIKSLYKNKRKKKKTIQTKGKKRKERKGGKEKFQKGTNS